MTSRWRSSMIGRVHNFDGTGNILTTDETDAIAVGRAREGAHPGPIVPFPFLMDTVDVSLGAVLGILLTAILGLVWFSMALPILVVCAASAILYIAEFCVRRIAESPKGIVLGGSAFLALIGAVLKVFGYGWQRSLREGDHAVYLLDILRPPPPPRICHNEQPSTLRPGVG